MVRVCAGLHAEAGLTTECALEALSKSNRENIVRLVTIPQPHDSYILVGVLQLIFEL